MLYIPCCMPGGGGILAGSIVDKVDCIVGCIIGAMVGGTMVGMAGGTMIFPIIMLAF